jgi:hypothetical protein
MAKKPRYCNHCKLAKKYLLELLDLTTVVESDEIPGSCITVPQFSEAGLYPTLGKDRARTVLALLGELAAVLGIDDLWGHYETVSDHKANFWKLQDALAVASSVANRISFEVSMIEESEDFANEVHNAKCDVERAVKFGHPDRKLSMVLHALSIDPETGKMDSKWKREEKQKKAKKTKKVARSNRK